MKNPHASQIPHYEDDMEGLVDFIVGKLRYDEVVRFHSLMADRYQQESDMETSRNRPKLAKALADVSESERETSELMKPVWDICEPYTE